MENGRSPVASGTESSSRGSVALAPVERAARRRGRQRSAEIDRAILDATLELLAEVGYERFTVNEVIARTGIRTEDVFLRFSAGEPISELAEDYGLTLDQAEAAIRAEAQFLEPLAA